jgi:hypothetical protein
LRIASKERDGERRPLLIAEEPDHDLPFPALPIPPVPKGRQFVLVPFHIAARHIIEKEAQVLGARVLPGEASLHRGLVLPQPIEIVLQVVLRTPLPAEDLADGMRPR